jgi:hypothetical protein
MKVNSSSNSPQTTTKQAKKKQTQSVIEARLAEKFGKEFGKTKKMKEQTDISKAKKKKEVVDASGEEKESFGDIGLNDPKSAATREKLKSVLQTGAFGFSDKERKALSEILNS